jgi:hypothetical protein
MPLTLGRHSSELLMPACPTHGRSGGAARRWSIGRRPTDPSSARWPDAVPFAPNVSQAVAAAAKSGPAKSGSTGGLRIASSLLQIVIASGSLGDDEAPLALLSACLLRVVVVPTLTPTGSAVPFRPENAARQVESQSAKLSAQQTSGARLHGLRRCRSQPSHTLGRTCIRRCESEPRSVSVEPVAFEQGDAAWLSASSSVVQESL